MKMFQITNSMLVAALLVSSAASFAMDGNPFVDNAQQPSPTQPTGNPTTPVVTPTTPVTTESFATKVKNFFVPAKMTDQEKTDKIAKLKKDTIDAVKADLEKSGKAAWAKMSDQDKAKYANEDAYLKSLVTLSVDEEKTAKDAFGKLNDTQKKAYKDEAEFVAKTLEHKLYTKADLFKRAKNIVKELDIKHTRLVRYSAVTAAVAAAAGIITGAVIGAKKLYNWIKGRKSEVHDVVSKAEAFKKQNLTVESVAKGSFATQFKGQPYSDVVFAAVEQFEKAFELPVKDREAVVNTAFAALEEALQPEKTSTENKENSAAKPEDKKEAPKAKEEPKSTTTKCPQRSANTAKKLVVPVRTK